MRKVCLGFLMILFVVSLWGQNDTGIRKIIIGGDSDFPPYEFINSQGNPDGYNVELSKEVAKILNWEPEFRLGKWALVMDWLQDGRVDLIQGMAFSLERARTFSFSSAHSVTWRSIFVRRDSDILSENDILDKSIAIQQDDVAEEYLAQRGFYGRLSRLPTQEIALKLLNEGDFDACVANYMIGMHSIREMNLQNIKALPQRINQREYCFAALDPDLIDQVNQALVVLNKNGTLEALHNKWLATDISAVGIYPIGYRWTQIIAILSLLLALVFLCICWFCRKSYRKLATKLRQQATIAENARKEFEAWQQDFANGPVVLYKCAINPLRVLYISPNITNWGISLEDAMNGEEAFWQFIFSEDREYVSENSTPNKPDEHSTLVYRVVNSKGDMHWVLDYARLMASPASGESFLYGYLIDITEQKNMEAKIMESKEKAEAANIAKSHFLANMSHEIRTPLNGITGFLQVLLQMGGSTQQQEIYDIMYASSRNLLKIINDILDFSKIETGKMELMISDFNLRYMVAELVKHFSYQNRRDGLVISYSISDEIPDVLKGDQLRLKQILTNLLQNAVKFTEKGKVEVIAEPYTVSESEVRLLIRVVDTGIGINPTKQQDIFDNYSQADNSISSKYGGTGLGLAIVKRLVELMNGFVWVESELGKGSSFFVILPFSTYNEQPGQPEQTVHPTLPKDIRMIGNVLLVEDDLVNQLVTIRQLSNWGLQVDLAKNGAEAVSMHQINQYDLILMDIQMPVMDGITATHKIRDLDVIQGKHTPIVAFTASALVGDRERFLATGMDEYISKPVDVTELYAILQNLIPQDKKG